MSKDIPQDGPVQRGWIRTRHKELEKIRQSIATLNDDEKSLLQTQLQKGEQTFYTDPFSVPSIPNFLKLHSLYQGLADKRILDISQTSDGKVKTLHITADAWKLLNNAKESRHG
jgi:hypothetical protein